MSRRFTGTFIRLLCVGGAVALSSWFASVPCFAQEDAMPSGWNTERVGDNIVLTPRDLPDGATFTLKIEPPFTLKTGEPKSWLAARVTREVESLGTTTDTAGAVPLNVPDLSIFSLVRTIQLSSGGQQLLTGFLARRPDGQYVYVRTASSPQEAVYKRYLPGALRGIMALARDGKGVGTKAAKTPGKKTPAKRRRPKGSTAYTRIGAGVKTSAIAGIYMRLAPQMGYGGMMTMDYVPAVVFKDGTFYEDFDVPLADFDVAAARRERPNAWGKWRKQGGVTQVLSEKRGWEKEEWLGPFPGAKPGETLSGRYFSFSGGGNTAMGGGTAYGVESDIRFSRDGRFTTGRATTLSSGTADVQILANNRSRSQGTYTLNGYTLTLKYDDGTVVRRSFVFMDTNGKQGGMYLDGVPYPRKN